MLNTIGSRLKHAREKRGLKQNFVAEKVGISQSTLANYERDHREPDSEALEKLADLYEVSFNWLYGRNEPTNDVESEPIYVYADPLGWIEKLAAEYKEQTGQDLPDWKKKAILELIEANRPEDKK